MLFRPRHILMLCALLALPGLAAGEAYADNGQGNGGPGNGGGNGNHNDYHGGGNQGFGGGNGPGGGPSGGQGQKGPGNNGQGFHGNGPGPGDGTGDHIFFGGPPPGDHNGNHGGGRFFNFSFHKPQPQPSPSALPASPPPDGDNGTGDDVINASVPAADLYGNKGPDASGQQNRASSPAAQFVKTPILDQDQSKFAVQNGKAASMPLLFTYLDQKYPGQVLDVKLHTTGDGLVYEVRYLANVVELRTLFLDAMTLSRK